MRSPEPVGTVIQKTLGRRGLLPKARRFQVFSLWPRVVGDIALNARPRRLDGDVLYVSTSSSMWAQELSMMRRRIISEINKGLGGDYIKDIRFSEHLWGTTGNFWSNESDNLQAKEYTEFLARTDLLSKPELARFETFLGEEHDARLSFTFQKFAVTMEKRKKYLVKKGYEKCSTCGYMYRPERKCPNCQAREEFYSHRRIISILEKHPEMSSVTLSVSTGISEKAQLERAREELDARWYRVAQNAFFRAGSGKLARHEKAQLRDVVMKLAMLRTGKPEHELTPQDINKAVGKRFSFVFEEKRGRRQAVFLPGKKYKGL